MAMKRDFQNLIFDGVDLDAQRQLGPSIFRGCTFETCTVGRGIVNPEQRLRISHCELYSCRTTRSTRLGPVIVEDTLIENLATSALAIAYGAVFARVSIAGKCGSFLVNRALGSFEEAFSVANDAFYSGVDWAIDISRAEFAACDLRAVPAKLVRRDPDTQVRVRYDRVAETRHIWEKLSLGGTPWQIAMQNGLRWGLRDEVFVAPKRSKNFKKWLAGLKLLQREGIAETD